MRHRFFDATVYSTQPEARVGITFKPTPYLSVYELNTIIDGLIWVLGEMGGPVSTVRSAAKVMGRVTVNVEKPVTPEQRARLEKLMTETRGTTLYEDLRDRTVYFMPWHPTTPKRVHKEPTT